MKCHTANQRVVSGFNLQHSPQRAQIRHSARQQRRRRDGVAPARAVKVERGEKIRSRWSPRVVPPPPPPPGPQQAPGPSHRHPLCLSCWLTSYQHRLRSYLHILRYRNVDALLLLQTAQQQRARQLGRGEWGERTSFESTSHSHVAGSCVESVACACTRG